LQNKKRCFCGQVFIGILNAHGGVTEEGRKLPKKSEKTLPKNPEFVQKTSKGRKSTKRKGWGGNLFEPKSIGKAQREGRFK